MFYESCVIFEMLVVFNIGLRISGVIMFLISEVIIVLKVVFKIIVIVRFKILFLNKNFFSFLIMWISFLILFNLCLL